MSDLPPPTPGQTPAWQPPAGPPPTGATGESPASFPSNPQPSPTDSPTPTAPETGLAPRPFLPDPRRRDTDPAPVDPAPSTAPTAPTAPTPPPAPLAPTAPQAPVASPPSGTWAGSGSISDPATTESVTAVHPPNPTAPPTPGASPAGRSRVPAVIGALAALAIGAGAVVWFTRSDESEDRVTSATTEPEPTDTSSDTTPITEPTPPTEPTPTTVPLVLPTTPAPPTTPVPTEAPTPTTPALPVLPAPPVPAGATPYADPSGWSIAVDPAWQFRLTDSFTGWFTGTGTTGFQDNVNVALEDLPGPRSLDEYVEAATGFISTSAADVQIFDQRRLVGADGVEVHVITWTGAVGGGQPLAFVQAMTVSPTRAYVATFTTQPARLADLAGIVGPYVASIRGT